MTDESQFLGVVQDGMFQQVLPDPGSGGPRKFTRIRPQEARPPESAPLQLADYEGSAIMIRGDDHGGWVYNAEVVDNAGPILTEVVKAVFGRARSR